MCHFVATAQHKLANKKPRMSVLMMARNNRVRPAETVVDIVDDDFEDDEDIDEDKKQQDTNSHV